MTRWTRRAIGWLAGLLPAWIVSLVAIGYGASRPGSLVLSDSAVLLVLPYWFAGRLFSGSPEALALVGIALGGCMQWVFKKVSGEVGPLAGAVAAIGWSALAALSPIVFYVQYLTEDSRVWVERAFLYQVVEVFPEVLIASAVFGQLIAVWFLPASSEAGAAGRAELV